ncbi:APC family permease [Parasporobacterium paucivorans]|uniref:Basic amino acid/polyamine antiporter, APA family n=1 Tax=Parasporobacterium paucivorans DSM 15970 TaxID=1122934 RepID=A0A1M6HJI5_9FIRM|nr:amino acid permease [Parasporobacterium paucivorans]SHJ22347.1 basic amino acid/polyamine antiporter, APA family [Parasporobacterium paucivorans DSM 15970]
MQKRHYGLLTAITMITGIVIGSGIFFKADDILVYTGGSTILGIIVFCIAAFAIIFGSLTISQLAMRTDRPGGIVTYAEDFVGMGAACAFGWFQVLLYLPALCAVVSWVTGIYICQLFGWEGTVFKFTIVGFFVLVFLFVVNTLSARLGGIFQNATMFIKLIPLLLIAVLGLVFGNPGGMMAADAEAFKEATRTAGWMTAFAPIAFSLDGWIVSTSIGHEIKNSKRNFPIALTVAPLVILVVYLLYFVGISSLVGTETIMAEGNDSVFLASTRIFGDFGAKMILIFVIVSVIGTVNGLVLGFIRMPYSLAIRGMIPGSKKMKKLETGVNAMPLNSAITAFLLSLFWLVINYITQSMGMKGDVSEIAICISYLIYVVLYVAVIRLARKREIKGVFKGYIIPCLAIVGSFIILTGSITHPLFPYYVLICLAVLAAGALYYRKNRESIH